MAAIWHKRTSHRAGECRRWEVEPTSGVHRLRSAFTQLTLRGHSAGHTPVETSQLLIALSEFKNGFFLRDCRIPVRILKSYQQRRRGGRPRNSLRERQGCQAKAGAASASQRGAPGKIRGKARQL